MVTIGGPFRKQPSEVLDYGIDLVKWFAKTSSEDFIIPDGLTVSVTGTGVAPDLEIGPGAQPTHSLLGSPARQLKVWVGGGVDGVDYKVTVKLVTDYGRELEVDFTVKVRDK